jgi:hypothetical protein
MARELDLVNRDPRNMNKYIEVEFDDVLAEPEGAHSADWYFFVVVVVVVVVVVCLISFSKFSLI